MIAQYDPFQIQQMLYTIECLETRIRKLEGVGSAPQESLLLKVGESSISMKKDGEVMIKGNDITLSASGKMSIKASSELTLKGQKIVEN